MRTIDEYKATGHPTVWKRTRKRWLKNQGLIACDYCNYHRLENRNKTSWAGDNWVRYDYKKRFVKPFRPWKTERRRHQYK